MGNHCGSSIEQEEKILQKVQERPRLSKLEHHNIYHLGLGLRPKTCSYCVTASREPMFLWKVMHFDGRPFVVKPQEDIIYKPGQLYVQDQLPVLCQSGFHATNGNHIMSTLFHIPVNISSHYRNGNIPLTFYRVMYPIGSIIYQDSLNSPFSKFTSQAMQIFSFQNEYPVLQRAIQNYRIWVADPWGTGPGTFSLTLDQWGFIISVKYDTQQLSFDKSQWRFSGIRLGNYLPNNIHISELVQYYNGNVTNTSRYQIISVDDEWKYKVFAKLF